MQPGLAFLAVQTHSHAWSWLLLRPWFWCMASRQVALAKVSLGVLCLRKMFCWVAESVGVAAGVLLMATEPSGDRAVARNGSCENRKATL